VGVAGSIHEGAHDFAVVVQAQGLRECRTWKLQNVNTPASDFCDLYAVLKFNSRILEMQTVRACAGFCAMFRNCP
jgi:hypothetical protein